MDVKRKGTLFRLTGLILVCFCLRSPMSPVGPLVSDIRASLGLSSGVAGLLTTIPLLLFGLVAPFGGRLACRVPIRLLTPLSLGLSLCGMLLRSYGGMAGLMAGTGMIGLGIGVLNVAVPVYIRTAYEGRIGVVMGVYTMSMTLFSALSAGFCVPLSQRLGGWSNGLAAFCVLPALAIPVWLLAIRRDPPMQEQPRSVSPRVARSGKNWCIALCMAFQSALFFSMIAWLPSVLRERGADGAVTGYLVLAMQLVSLTTNFLMPVLMQRFRNRHGLFALLCGVVYAAGFSLLLRDTVPPPVRGVSVALLGLACGASLSFALTMITMQGTNRRETAAVSAFAQCIGYLFAAPAPFLLGALYDAAGSFRAPVLMLMALSVPLALCGMLAARQKKNASAPEE